MRARGFGQALLVLILVGMMSAGAIQKSWAEEKAAPAALLGPAGWDRVDGQDHDLDELLSLFRPKEAETLAVFAPLQAWKPFYDKVYGRTPIDLALYATIYRLSPAGPDLPDLNDWPPFYQDVPASTLAADPSLPRRGELLGHPSDEAVTFKMSLAPAAESDLHDRQDEDKGAQTTYGVITSIILNRQEVFFLNLFKTDQDDFAELANLALAWRADFIETNTLAPMEEPLSEEDL